jgi:hypothetical protein
MTNTKEKTNSMAYNARTIKTKRRCDIEGCDEPMIGLGEPHNVYEFTGGRGYAIRLCPTHYKEEQALKDLDPFTREVRRQRLAQERRKA